MSNLTSALEYLDSGLSVIPTSKDTKKPRVSTWAAFQQFKATPEQVGEWFQNGAQLAVICGTVSGNLEVIDFDEKGLASEWRAKLALWNCLPILEKCLIETSPRGGHHIAYRHSGKPEGNQKLALSKEKKCLIETRGEGGYCLVSPSDGYKIKQGKWLDLPILTPEEREALLACARTFDESPPEVPKAGDNVWDDYNNRASIDEIIIPIGWQRCGSKGVEEYWVRPDKDKRHGHSATWNWNGLGLFRVFSSSCGLEPRAYDKFGLYARLHHNGDFKAATISASRSGYGSSPKEVVAIQASERRWGALAEIAPEDIDWFWKPYIPSGMVTLVYGDGGIGKSTATLALAACLSVGGRLPGGATLKPGNTIILSAEDPPAQVIVPRLISMGADMNRIIAPEEFDEEGEPNPMILDEAGAAELSANIRDAGANLVIIDPVLAYFEAVRDMNSGTDVRAWMRRLSNVARSTGCAMVLIHHVNKAASMKAQHRAMGSADFVNAARSALMAIQDPEDESNCAFHHTKHNLSPKGQTIGYTITEDRGFEWTGESDLTPEACAVIAESRVSPKQGAEAKDWLERTLANGPMSSKDLFEGAKIAGIQRNAIFKAKKGMGVHVRKHGMDGGWYWYLADSSYTSER